MFNKFYKVLTEFSFLTKNAVNIINYPVAMTDYHV